MRCAACGQENRDSQKSCSTCGAALVRESETCPACSKTIPINSRFCPHCTLPLGFDQAPALAEEFEAQPSTMSAERPSGASTVTRVAVSAIALVALAALAVGGFQYSQVLKDRRIAVERLQQEKQAAAAAEQRAREEADQLKQQQEQAKAAADAERAKQEEAQRQQEEHQKQLAEAREKERQVRMKAEQDAAEKARAAAAQDTSAAVPDAAAATTASARRKRHKPAKLAKASLPKGSYHIDVDGVRQRADADALAGKLQKLGFSAYLVPSEDDDGLWVVRIGPFKTQEEADAAEQEMTEKYQASLKAN